MFKSCSLLDAPTARRACVAQAVTAAIAETALHPLRARHRRWPRSVRPLCPDRCCSRIGHEGTSVGRAWCPHCSHVTAAPAPCQCAHPLLAASAANTAFDSLEALNISVVPTDFIASSAPAGGLASAVSDSAASAAPAEASAPPLPCPTQPPSAPLQHPQRAVAASGRAQVGATAACAVRTTGAPAAQRSRQSRPVPRPADCGRHSDGTGPWCAGWDRHSGRGEQQRTQARQARQELYSTLARRAVARH